MIEEMQSLNELIIDVLEKLNSSNYIDPAEDIYDAVKEIRRHLGDADLEKYIHDFLWGLESSTVLDVDGVVAESAKRIRDFTNRSLEPVVYSTHNTKPECKSQPFYIVEIRKYHTFPYTEFPCLFLSESLQKAIDYIKNDDGYPNKSYHWYWVIIEMFLNEDDTGTIVKVFDKYGNETTENIMLDLD